MFIIVSDVYCKGRFPCTQCASRNMWPYFVMPLLPHIRNLATIFTIINLHHVNKYCPNMDKNIKNYMYVIEKKILEKGIRKKL